MYKMYISVYSGMPVLLFARVRGSLQFFGPMRGDRKPKVRFQVHHKANGT